MSPSHPTILPGYGPNSAFKTCDADTTVNPCPNNAQRPNRNQNGIGYADNFFLAMLGKAPADCARVPCGAAPSVNPAASLDRI